MGKIAVIGAGSWGTALAQTLAAAGNEVVMWARKPEVAEAITKEHHNPRYLSGIMLSDSISATSNLRECAEHAEALVIVTPSRLMRQCAQDPCPIAALSGPNHAEEVILGVPAGTVIASRSRATAHYFRDLFTTSYFRCYTSPDYVGVELCAAFKNVIAIAVGAAYGAGFGDNTAAMIMTRGMAEMSRLVKACGGDALTVMGLAGAGDLIATCTSEHSRNRSFGKALAQGATLGGFEKRTHMVVEGAVACQTICPLAEKHNVELPITTAVRSLVWEGAPIEPLAADLFKRPLTTEFWGLDEAGETR